MSSRSTAIQFGKFLAVGTPNTMIDFGTLLWDFVGYKFLVFTAPSPGLTR
jgi:putative flippase GtrA